MVAEIKAKTVSVNSKYNGGLTREQFLFYEMRTTAKLLNDGYSEPEAVEKIINENLFQYLTATSADCNPCLFPKCYPCFP